MRELGPLAVHAGSFCLLIASSQQPAGLQDYNSQDALGMGRCLALGRGGGQCALCQGPNCPGLRTLVLHLLHVD